MERLAVQTPRAGDEKLRPQALEGGSSFSTEGGRPGGSSLGVGDLDSLSDLLTKFQWERAGWDKSRALELTRVGLNPTSSTYQLCDLGKLFKSCWASVSASVKWIPNNARLRAVLRIHDLLHCECRQV